ncbi:MAG TPA: hypothetical protein VIV14_12440 [Gammaproteobacteria bacterium]
MSFFAELRRRNVFRVVAGYVVMSWLIMQIVSVIANPLNLPDWFETVVVVLLGIGLLIAIVVAWAFELTPDGIKLSTSDGSAPAASGGKLDYVLIAALVLVAAATFLSGRPEALPEIDERSIAVLPFTDLSPERDQEYFGDGIAEELLNELTRLEGLRVAGRTSSFAYKGRNEDLRTIGAELGIATILEGSVRKDGETLRITAQLIDVSNGSHLWSDTYDRELDDIFAIQEDIATQVAGRLGVQLGVGDVNAFQGAGTTNVAAYEAYLEGLARTDYDAIPYLRRATTLDENYAAAWALLAVRTAATQWTNPPEQAPDIRAEAIGYAERAVELDPQSAEAQSLYGTLLYASRNYIDGEAAHLEAISILANRDTQVQYGNLLSRAGRSSDAIERYEAAREADVPLHRPSSQMWANYLALGRIDEAREVVGVLDLDETPIRRLSIAFNAGDREEIRSLMEDLASMPGVRSALYSAALENFDSPQAAHASLRAIHEDSTLFWPGKGHDLGMLAAWFGDPELALESLVSEVQYTSVRQWSLWLPHLSEVRRLQGYKELVTSINLVDFWRASGWSDHCRPVGADDFTCE